MSNYPFFKQNQLDGKDRSPGQDNAPGLNGNPQTIMELLNAFVVTPTVLQTSRTIDIGSGNAEILLDPNHGVYSTRGFALLNSDFNLNQSSGQTAADDRQSQITFSSNDLNFSEYTAFKIYYEKGNGPLYISDYSKTTYISLQTNSVISMKADETLFYGQYASNGSVGGTFAASQTINWNTGNVQLGAVSQNTTFAFTNGLTGGRYIIRILQDESGSRTYTWPASVKWPGGVAPTPSGANKYDLFSFVFDGTRYFGGSNLNY